MANVIGGNLADERADLMTKFARIIGGAGYGADDTELLSVYLDMAADKILNRRYPFGAPEGAIVESRWLNIQLEIAVYLFNKRGAEGESLHSENGISRSYGGETDVPASLLMRVTPKGAVC